VDNLTDILRTVKSGRTQYSTKHMPNARQRSAILRTPVHLVSSVSVKSVAQRGSYQTIKAQVRRDHAIHYLGHGSMSVEAVAEKVGYTETSTFIRAFKQWTGCTPMQFRKGLEI